MRVMTVYFMQYDVPCTIEDSTNMTVIQLLPPPESSYTRNLLKGDLPRQYLVNGDMQDLNIGTWYDNHINYDSTIKLNPDKKYLSLRLGGALIMDKLELGAASLEVLDVKGKVINHSTLKIAPSTQSFNTTLLGNVIVTDDTSTLTLKGLSNTHNTITFSKRIIDHMPSYTIEIGDSIKEIISSIRTHNAINNIDYALMYKSPNKVQELLEKHINYHFSSKEIKGHFNTPQHSIVSFSGTIDGKNTELQSSNGQHMLDILDSQGNIIERKYTYYKPDAISIGRSAYITRVFDYTRWDNTITRVDYLNIHGGELKSLEHSILHKGRAYEFTTLDGSTITYHFPQTYNSIKVNNITYSMVNGNLCAIDGQDHKIDGDNLLSIGTKDNKANIYFPTTLGNIVADCKANDLIIDGITLHNIAPNTKIVFSDITIPLDGIADTINCNTNAHKRNKRDLQQEKGQADNLEISAMISSATVSGSWINDGVKAIKSLFNTLLYKSLQSGNDQYREYKESVTEIIPNGTSFEEVVTESSTLLKTSNVLQSDNELIVYSKKDPNGSITLDNCTAGAQYEHEYVDGATCRLPDGRSKVMIFPIKPVDTCAAPMTEAQDNYKHTSCTPIEFNGQKSVYCEGEKTSAIYTPAETARLFDNIDSNLMLGRVLLHSLHKVWRLITTTEVVENKVIINENMQKQWIHDIKNINNLLQTIPQEIELREFDKKIINNCNNILEDIQEDIARGSQTLVDSINNRLQDLEAELTEMENSYYCDAEDSDKMHTAHEEAGNKDVIDDLAAKLHFLSKDTQAQCTNTQEIQTPHNIGINYCAENHIYSESLLGNINNASETNLF